MAKCNVGTNMSQLFIRPALLLAFLFFNALAVGAQSELDRMINGLQSKYNKISTLSADFTQVHTSRDQRERRENGNLLLKKPGRMKWDYTTPEEKHFISDGKWLYEYVPADKAVTRSSLKETGDMRAPFAFLLGQAIFDRSSDALNSPKNLRSMRVTKCCACSLSISRISTNC